MSEKSLRCVVGSQLSLCLAQPPECLPNPIEDTLPDITGYYSCRGTDTSGKEYRGVTFTDKVEQTYLVIWVTGGVAVKGVGHRVGDMLSVGWKAGELIGVTVYTIRGRILEGHHQTVPGKGEPLPERLQRLKRLDDEA